MVSLGREWVAGDEVGEFSDAVNEGVAFLLYCGPVARGRAEDVRAERNVARGAVGGDLVHHAAEPDVGRVGGEEEGQGRVGKMDGYRVDDPQLDLVKPVDEGLVERELGVLACERGEGGEYLAKVRDELPSEDFL